MKLIENGIQEKKLPIFTIFTKFQMKTTNDYIYMIEENKSSDVLSFNEQLTLTEIFHQFDTISLRGRTSIDRYLNIQRAKELVQHSHIENNTKSTLINRRSIPFDHRQELNSLGSIQNIINI